MTLYQIIDKIQYFFSHFAVVLSVKLCDVGNQKKERKFLFEQKSMCIIAIIHRLILKPKPKAKKRIVHPLTYISKYVYYYYYTTLLMCVHIEFVFLLETTLNMTCSLHVNNVLIYVCICIVSYVFINERINICVSKRTLSLSLHVCAPVFVGLFFCPITASKCLSVSVILVYTTSF